jgi:ubiquitin C
VQREATLHLVLRLKGGGFQIFVRTLVGDCFSKSVEPSDTIEGVKGLFFNHNDLGKEGIELKLIYAGVILEDGRTLVDYNVQGGAVLYLVVCSRAGELRLRVRTLRSFFDVPRVKLSDSVADVKAKIQDQEGIPHEQQRLVFAGHEVSDCRTLASYNVGQGSSLFLVERLVQTERPPMRIHIRTLTCRRFDLDVYPTSTIDFIKEQLHDRTEYPLDEMRLVSRGREIGRGEDGQHTLEHYEVQEDSVLNLVLRLKLPG